MSRLIVVATGNAGKVKEFANAFEQSPCEFKTQKEMGFFEDVVENGKTFKENAEIKARAVFEFLKSKGIAAAVLSDDSGLEVKALNGAPGIYSARYAGEHGNSTANCNKLLFELQTKKDRSARFVSMLCLIDEKGKAYFFEGTCPGKIISEFRGKNGFGYDPIFVPEGESLTFAEIPLQKKQTMSHRGHAVANLKAAGLL